VKRKINFCSDRFDGALKELKLIFNQIKSADIDVSNAERRKRASSSSVSVKTDWDAASVSDQSGCATPSTSGQPPASKMPRLDESYQESDDDEEY
jgi:hypothetical protein